MKRAHGLALFLFVVAAGCGWLFAGAKLADAATGQGGCAPCNPWAMPTAVWSINDQSGNLMFRLTDDGTTGSTYMTTKAQSPAFEYQANANAELTFSGSAGSQSTIVAASATERLTITDNGDTTLAIKGGNGFAISDGTQVLGTFEDIGTAGRWDLNGLQVGCADGRICDAGDVNNFVELNSGFEIRAANGQGPIFYENNVEQFRIRDRGSDGGAEIVVPSGKLFDIELPTNGCFDVFEGSTLAFDICTAANTVFVEDGYSFKVSATATGVGYTKMQAKKFSIDFAAPAAGDCTTETTNTWTGATASDFCTCSTTFSSTGHFCRCRFGTDQVLTQMCVNDGATAGGDPGVQDYFHELKNSGS